MFRFHISDLGVFLGKSPEAIRAWERKGLVTLPRNGATRLLNTQQVREVAQIAFRAGRISGDRLYLICDALGALALLERESS